MKKDELEKVETAMKLAGFNYAQTGGSCDAYIKHLGNLELWVTCEANVPAKFSDPIQVGLYKMEGQELIGKIREFKTLNEFLKTNEEQLVDEILAKKYPISLAGVVDRLYSTLSAMLESRKGWDENGQLDFHQNDLDSMEETRCQVRIAYYLLEPNGDREKEFHNEWKQAGGETLDVETAYRELLHRLQATRFY